MVDYFGAKRTMVYNSSLSRVFFCIDCAVLALCTDRPSNSGIYYERVIWTVSLIFLTLRLQIHDFII